MTVEVEPGHEDDTVDAKLPLLPKHNLSLTPEVTSTDVFMACLLSLEELLALGEANSESTNTDRDTSTCPEYNLEMLLVPGSSWMGEMPYLPGFRLTTNSQICASSQDVSKRVTLLQDTGHQTSGIDGAMLKSHCDGVTIDTSHE